MWGVAATLLALFAFHGHHHRRYVDRAHIEENAIEVKLIEKERREGD